MFLESSLHFVTTIVRVPRSGMVCVSIEICNILNLVCLPVFISLLIGDCHALSREATLYKKVAHQDKSYSHGLEWSCSINPSINAKWKRNCDFLPASHCRSPLLENLFSNLLLLLQIFFSLAMYFYCTVSSVHSSLV